MKKKEMSEEQSRLYAEELGKLYQEEQRLRKDLEQEKQLLEYRLRELTGLNQMFQSFLVQHHELLGYCNTLFKTISELHSQTTLFQQKISEFNHVGGLDKKETD